MIYAEFEKQVGISIQDYCMESLARNRNGTRIKREKTVSSELYTEHLLSDLLRQGEAQGVFAGGDHQLTASLVKAMLQH